MPHGMPPDTAPPHAASLVAPRLLELCFQTAGLWEMTHRNVLGLPSTFRSALVHRQPQEARGRRLWAEITASGGGFGGHVVDDDGNVFVELSGYRTIALPERVELGGS